MADPFAGAKSNIDEQKLGALQAMAQAGTAGKEAYEAARRANDANQQAAVARLAQNAATGGLGASTPDMSGIIQGALAGRSAGLNSAQASFEADNARRTGANEAYFNQLGAAIPLLQARVKETIGTREAEIKKAIELARQEAERKAQEEALKYQRELEREARAEARAIERENRSAARADAKDKSKPPSDSELETILTGRARRADEKGLVGNRFPDMPAGVLQGGKLSLSQVARQLGVNAGYDPDVVYGRLGPEDDVRVARASDALATLGKPKTDPAVKAAATRSRVSADDYVKIVNGSDYKSQVDKAMQLLSAGATREEVIAAWRTDLLNRGPGKAPMTRTFSILESELAPLFPSITESTRLADYLPAE